jgi:5-methylcytosine-specific restriction endonuclease McrA
MTNVLKTNVLVLNKSWQPINIVDSFTAISDVYVGRAEIIGPNYCTHDFESWVRNWEDIHTLEGITPAHIINTPSYTFPLPEIVKYVSASYFGTPKVKFSRKNIFKRDNNTCQYCVRQLPTKDLNIDHVIPRANGGRSTWENVVVSCIKCNSLKGHKSVEQIGFKLLKKPTKPTWISAGDKLNKRNSMPNSWEAFMGKLYWSAELEEDK